jgi:hypothetical protein
MDRNKKYQVFIQDEWNNNTLIGFYDNLEDAIPEINEYLKDCYNVQIDELKEYASTFNMCFDKDVEIDDGDNSIMIRGFIFD